MSKPRHHNFYLILCAILQMNNLHSQSTTDIERQIKVYFEQLKTANSTMTTNKQDKFFPLYESLFFQEKIKNEKIESGALCKEYFKSEKLELLSKINILCTTRDTNALYNLIDENGNRVYDLVRYNCSGIKTKLGKTDAINQNAINDLISSYKKWYQILKAKGFEKTQKENIKPTSFSKYKWIKEIGYLSGNMANSEILERYFEIKKDSSYLNYFINSQDLSRFYKGKTSIAILNEVLILSLVNNQTSFTTNILYFKLQGKEADINEIIKQLEAEKGINDLIQLLTEKNISIVFKM